MQAQRSVVCSGVCVCVFIVQQTGVFRLIWGDQHTLPDHVWVTMDGRVQQHMCLCVASKGCCGLDFMYVLTTLQA